MNKINSNIWNDLIVNAKTAFQKAYAPYSDFKVGAAALTSNKKIVQGCNVENASYGLTVCAERNCIAQGVINHEDKNTLELYAMVIYTEQEKLTPPCGACRQVIAEFLSSSAPIMAVNHLGEKQEWTVEQLLPDAFTPHYLLNKT